MEGDEAHCPRRERASNALCVLASGSHTRLASDVDHNDSLGLALFTDSVAAPEALRRPLVQDFVSAGADAATSYGAMHITISPTLRIP